MGVDAESVIAYEYGQRHTLPDGSATVLTLAMHPTYASHDSDLIPPVWCHGSYDEQYDHNTLAVNPIRTLPP